jgi:hypothetical protein
MRRYNTSRHRKLMDVSEYALRDATESSSSRESRIANTILDDGQAYHQWELRHADLLLPVAQHSGKKRQIVELRQAKVQLVHRRAFFKYLQNHDLSAERRKQLFGLFHATRGFKDAVLAEHRQYMLAVSSRISTDHIIEVMDDAMSTSLLRQYEKVFGRYYEMKCYLACARDSSCIELVRTSLREVQGQLMKLRRRIATESPVGYGGNFERQELFARSARHEAVNYLNA